MMRNQRGFALLAVFWLVLLLSILALGYASSTRLRAQAALNQVQIVQRYYDDSAAFARGYQAYTTYLANRPLFVRRQLEEPSPAQRLGLWYPRFEPYLASMVSARVQIRYASGRFDVNKLKAATWNTILTCCGVERESERSAIINSVLDWCDSDNAHHAQGAENDYYHHLKPEYNCKNAPIEVLEELLLVKGITAELYYGNLNWQPVAEPVAADDEDEAASPPQPYHFNRDEQHPGLIHFLSVYGAEAKLDINSAAPQALLLIEDITAEQIAAIVARRSQEAITKLADLSEILDTDQFVLLKRYFTVISAPRYLVVAVSAAGAKNSPLLWQQRVFDLNEKQDKNL